MVAELEHPWASKRQCPDDGRCTHDCGPEVGCWRVSFCAPLSGYAHDDWTVEDRAANANPPTTIEPPATDYGLADWTEVSEMLDYGGHVTPEGIDESDGRG